MAFVVPKGKGVRGTPQQTEFTKAQQQKLSRAKAALVLQQPFFAGLLLRLPLHCDDTLDPPTLATNGRWVRIHPAFIDGSDHDELVFGLCHEVMHGAFQHMVRRGNRHPMKWNIAGDYIINEMLVKEQIGRMPHGCLYNPQIVKDGGGHAEGVYALLPDQPDDEDGGGGGRPLDNCEDASADPTEKAEVEMEWKVATAQAAQAAKMHGRLSGNLKRFVDEVLKPVVDWREVTRQFFSARAKVEATFARPKRRWIGSDLILPSLNGEKLGPVVVAMDCSGSTMSPPIIAAFAGEMKAIHEDCRPEATEVIYWDTKVQGHDTYGPDDTLKIKVKGGGGTQFADVLRYIEGRDIRPCAMVVLTDLYIGDFGPQPDYPVLWVSNGGDTAPWGEVVKIDKRTI